MKRALIAIFGVMLLAGGIASIGTPAHEARAETVIESTTLQNDYPKSLTFKITARADVDITDLTLSYSLVGRGTSALGKPASLTPAKNLSSEVVIQVNSGQSYIPVGSEFVYSWEVTTADGQTTKSAQQRFLFLPPDQDWKSVTGDFMVVYYHGDRESLANAYLKAGIGTYDKIGKGLFNIQLQQVPVKVVLFDDEKESDKARPGSGLGRFDSAVTTCGTKLTNDILHMIPVSCGTADRTDTLRHELGHILNQTAGEGALGKLPSWLDEGTAVYAQSTPGDGYVGAFEAAARAGRLIPFSQMGTPSGDAARVNLFYGQSYAMAKYLIDKGGPAKYAEFFGTIKRGARFDEALKTAYGFDLAGFEQEFARANGTRPVTQATVAPTSSQQQAQPTTAPATRPAQAAPTRAATAAPRAQVTNTNGDDEGIDRVAVAAIGAALIFALLAVFAFLLAQLFGSGKQAAPAATLPPPDPVDWGKKDE